MKGRKWVWEKEHSRSDLFQDEGDIWGEGEGKERRREGNRGRGKDMDDEQDDRDGKLKG